MPKLGTWGDIQLLIHWEPEETEKEEWEQFTPLDKYEIWAIMISRKGSQPGPSRLAVNLQQVYSLRKCRFLAVA